jgi:hypothetical protein
LPTTKLKTGDYMPPSKPTMQRMRHRHSIAAILCILGTLQLPLLLPTMVIATCSSNRLQPIQKATPVKMPTPKGGKQRSECQLNKSLDVNAILVDINFPQTQFKTILTVLGPAAERSNEIEDNPASPEHYNPSDDKADNSDPPSNQISPPTSPNPEPTYDTKVRINETPDSVFPPVNNPATATTQQAPCYILCGAPPHRDN